jgi:type II secretory pathway pseudopilin PulG
MLRSWNFTNHGKVAFTLAEVLITLGIIGVVAAMTLPTVITNIQNAQFKSAYKKAYSSASQALTYMRANDDFLPIVATLGNSAHHSDNFGENFKILSKYFKATKTCFDSNADKCWECDGEAGYYQSSAPNWKGCTKSSYAFVDYSGMSWYMYKNDESSILVDVNGFKAPNQLGRDRFVFFFAQKEYKTTTTNIQEANMIKTQTDIVEKGRWCPKGNCLYTTLLYK